MILVLDFFAGNTLKYLMKKETRNHKSHSYKLK